MESETTEIVPPSEIAENSPESLTPTESQNSLSNLRLSPVSGGEPWAGENKVKKKPKRVKRILTLVSLGLGSFLVFLYLTFPYGVMKEVVNANILQALKASGLNMTLRLGRMEPYWLTGIAMYDVTLQNPTKIDKQLKFDKVTARLNILPILWGKIRISANIIQDKGNISLSTDLPLFALIKGQGEVSAIDITLKSFKLDALMDQVLSSLTASSSPAMLLVKPIVSKTIIGGSLSGDIYLDIPDGNFARATGKVLLAFQGLFLHIADETLKISKQDFSTAKIDLDLKAGNIQIANTTQLQAQDIGIALAGGLKNSDQGMVADLDMTLNMRAEVEKNLGFIVPQMLQCRSLVNGELKAKLQGPISGGMKCL